MSNRILLVAVFIFSSLCCEAKVSISSEEILKQYPFLQQIHQELTIGYSNRVFAIGFAEVDKLPESTKNIFSFAHFQIIDNKLYGNSFSQNREKYQKKVYLDLFARILKKYKVPNVEIVISAGDGEPNLEDKVAILKKIPIYVMSRNKNSSSKYILIPDLYMLDSPKWDKLYKNILKKSDDIEWQEKREKIFWRGANTGSAYSVDNWYKLPRLTLTLLSEIYPDKIDAKFSNMVEGQFANDEKGEQLKTALKILFGKHYSDNHAAEVDHLKDKYLISIDGNTCAWKRVPWIMLSNSVLLKQASDHEQWFYPSLKNMENYLEVKNDLSDIFEKIEWLKNNDAKARQISANASKFVQENLKTEDIEKQFLYVLLIQHSLMNYKLEKPTLPVYE